MRREPADVVDIVDFRTPSPVHKYPPATVEEFEDIKQAVLDSPWTDLTRIGDCFHIALEVLGGIATGDSAAAHDASQALRRMMQRTVQGEIAADVEARSW